MRRSHLLLHLAGERIRGGIVSAVRRTVDDDDVGVGAEIDLTAAITPHADDGEMRSRSIHAVRPHRIMHRPLQRGLDDRVNHVGHTIQGLRRIDHIGHPADPDALDLMAAQCTQHVRRVGQ